MGFDRKAYMKEYHKKHYAEHRQEYLDYAKQWTIENPEAARKRANRYYHKHKEKILDKVRENKRRAVQLFGGVCVDCKQQFPDCVYDFHHVDTKDVNPSVALRGSWDSALKELEKCTMLCANCHRKRHFLE